MAEIYISVDVEATGPIPGEYSMASIGAVVVEDVQPSSQRTFYTVLRPLAGAKVNNEAIAVSGFTEAFLRSDGIDPYVAMSQFDRWLQNIKDTKRVGSVSFPKEPRLTMASFGEFDWLYVAWYLHKFIGRCIFGPNGLDIKSYAGGALHRHYEKSHKQALPEWVRGTAPHTHNALDDAIEQAQQLKRLLRYQCPGGTATF